ncbi:hypothetical protein N665_3155s0004 [Sinapis alba]|nr:hypothetical protein N665_3155s0004 [Sinapis alba]
MGDPNAFDAKHILHANATCTLCNSSIETRNHLFFQCSYSESIWSNLTRNLLLHDYSNVWSLVLQRLTDSSLEGTRQFLVRMAFQSTVYMIWRERNGRRHGQPSHEPALLIAYVDKHIRNSIDSVRGRIEAKYSHAMGLWFASR